jgi:hypothetical protein
VFPKGIVPLSRGLAMLSPEVVSQSRPLLSTCSTTLDMSNDLPPRASTAAGVMTSIKPMSICTGMRTSPRNAVRRTLTPGYSRARRWAPPGACRRRTAGRCRPPPAGKCPGSSWRRLVSVESKHELVPYRCRPPAKATLFSRMLGGTDHRASFACRSIGRTLSGVGATCHLIRQSASAFARSPANGRCQTAVVRSVPDERRRTARSRA